MDDLLSVALSEAGLDEFFVSSALSSPSEQSNEQISSENATSTSKGYTSFTSHSPSPAVTPVSEANTESTSAVSDVGNSNSRDSDGVRSTTPSTSLYHSPSAPVLSTSSPTSGQEATFSETQPSIRTNVSSVSRPSTSVPVPEGQTIRRIVQTPNGPQTQFLRAFKNEKGQLVYRAIRTVSSANRPARGVGRAGGTVSHGLSRRGVSSEVSQQPRVVVVRQITPNGPVLVRKTIPPGSTITSTVGRGGNVIRRVVSRGGGTPAADARNGTRPISSSHSQIHSETGHQYISSSPAPVPCSVPRILRGTSKARPVLSRGATVYRQPVGNQIIPRTNGVYSQRSPVPSRPGSAQGSLPSTRTYGSPMYGGSSRKSSLQGVGGSSPSVTTVRGHEYVAAEPIFEPGNVFRENGHSSGKTSPLATNSIRRTNTQLSSLALEKRLRAGANRTLRTAESSPSLRAMAGAEPVGAFEEIDVKGLMSPASSNDHSSLSPRLPMSSSNKPGPPPSKLQKAKDDMKDAILAAANKRTEADDDEENLGYAETYSDYRPAKLRSGLAHPDCVVETASLSSVAPPDVKYQISIPEDLIDTGSVSALQLEAVIYACQAHEQRLPSGERCGYLIGDGAGVGKGRTVACIIYENYLLGRKRSVWLSVSSDLKFDSERDLRDIGAGRIKVFSLNKLKYAKISGKENGSVKKGCLFATYSSLIGTCRSAKSKYQTRLGQIVQWFGVDYDGVIILDECHRAKNLCPSAGGKATKTGKAVLELQEKLPNARIVYASATGATEPRNMAYMTRIGLWGVGQAFPAFSDFIDAVERRGVGAMEIVAMDMKQRGLYLARQLSFRGVTFRVEEVPLSEEFIKIYDDSVKLWLECRRQFQAVLSTMSDEERSGCKQVWGQFWASHQRFFKYLCIGAKVETCVRMTREAIKSNKCVVIGLQSTGEARTLETLEEMGGELTEFVSTTKAVLQGLIEKHFPTEKGGCVDVFKDFDRMFDDFERPRKRKNRKNPLGFDVLDELGLGFGPTLNDSPAAKRARGNDDNSSTSSDEELSDGGTDSEDSEGEPNLVDRGEDYWVNAIQAEAASSSDSEDDDEDSDDEEEEKAPDNRTRSCGDDDFNPFACDFSQNDPWAAKQQIVDDSPKKASKTFEKSEQELEISRIRRRARRKKKKRRLEKIREVSIVNREKRVLNTDAMQGTAKQFISSSRIIDENGMGSDINPQMIKAELLAAVERLGTQLPANTLDQLIDELGGPEFVAEMTGRKGRVVTREDGEVEYELRHAGADVPLELMNMDEKDKFMKGTKLVAVLSEAASSGISLQSDRRAPNQRRRVHITLELPWSADKAIQQFGRTHRSNQVSAPEYVFLISELAGEKRFASIVAKRLESLGALTHGDRRATESRDLSQFNLDTKYGRSALDVLLRSVIGTLSPPLIPPPDDYKPGDFFTDMRLYMEGVGLLSRLDNGQYLIEREAATIAKFLNRILGIPVHAQNSLFKYFTDICNELIAQAKHDGTYDMGIMDLGTGGDQVRKQETRVFLGRVEKGSFRVEIHKIGVERGVSWEDAHSLFLEHNTGEDGFYISNTTTSGRRTAILVYGIGKKRLDSGARLYAVTRPSTGRSPKMETFADLSKRYTKVSEEDARPVWIEQYEGANQMCQHSYVHGKCRNEAAGTYCEVGRRTRTYFVLSGSVLSVWPVVEEVLNGDDRRASRIQVIRVRTDQDQKIVGLLVLPNYVRELITGLEEHCGRCFVEQNKIKSEAQSEIKAEIKTEIKTEIKQEI